MIVYSAGWTRLFQCEKLILETSPVLQLSGEKRLGLGSSFEIATRILIAGRSLNLMKHPASFSSSGRPVSDDDDDDEEEEEEAGLGWKRE